MSASHVEGADERNRGQRGRQLGQPAAERGVERDAFAQQRDGEHMLADRGEAVRRLRREGQAVLDAGEAAGEGLADAVAVEQDDRAARPCLALPSRCDLGCAAGSLRPMRGHRSLLRPAGLRRGDCAAPA
jgi:hypothetical protein